MTIRLILLLILLTPINGVCQGHSIKWYTSDDKQLPQNTVKSIVKDKYNFIWLGTENGLVRFDGKNFITFNINSATIENRPQTIEGTIQGDKLYTFYENEKSYAIITERNVKICANCDVPFYKDALQAFNQNSLLVKRKMTLDAFKFPYHFELSDRSKFTVQNGVIRYYNSKNKLLQRYHLKNYNPDYFFVNNNNLYYQINEKKLLRFDKNGTQTTINTDLNFKTNDYLIIRNYAHKQLFILYEDTLFYFDPDRPNSNYIPLLKDESLKNKEVNEAFYNSDTKVLYLGTPSNGLGIVRFNTINVLKENKKASEINYAIAAYKGNQIFTGNKNIYSNDKFVKSLDNNEFKTASRGIIVTDFDKIVVLDFDGISEYNPDKNFKKRSIYYDIREPRIITKGLNGKFWFAFKYIDTVNKETFGYIKYSKSGYNKPVYFSTKDTLNSVYELGNNNVLLNSNHGLYRFNTTTKTSKLLYKGINIRTISKTNGNFYWLTTYGQGLYLYHKNKVVKLPSDNPALSTRIVFWKMIRVFIGCQPTMGYFSLRRAMS